MANGALASSAMADWRSGRGRSAFSACLGGLLEHREQLAATAPASRVPASCRPRDERRQKDWRATGATRPRPAGSVSCRSLPASRPRSDWRGIRFETPPRHGPHSRRFVAAGARFLPVAVAPQSRPTSADATGRAASLRPGAFDNSSQQRLRRIRHGTDDGGLHPAVVAEPVGQRGQRNQAARIARFAQREGQLEPHLARSGSLVRLRTFASSAGSCLKPCLAQFQRVPTHPGLRIVQSREPAWRVPAPSTPRACARRASAPMVVASLSISPRNAGTTDWSPRSTISRCAVSRRQALLLANSPGSAAVADSRFLSHAGAGRNGAAPLPRGS